MAPSPSVPRTLSQSWSTSSFYHLHRIDDSDQGDKSSDERNNTNMLQTNATTLSAGTASLRSLHVPPLHRSDAPCDVLNPRRCSKSYGLSSSGLISDCLHAPIVIGFTSNKKKQRQFFESLQQTAMESGRFVFVPLPLSAGDSDVEDNSDGVLDGTSKARRGNACVANVAELNAVGAIPDSPVTTPTTPSPASSPHASRWSSPALDPSFAPEGAVMLPPDAPGATTMSIAQPQLYDAILHKRTDDMAAAATAGDVGAAARVACLEEALRQPGVVCVDNISGIWCLIDRKAICAAVQRALDGVPTMRHLAWTVIPRTACAAVAASRAGDSIATGEDMGCEETEAVRVERAVLSSLEGLTFPVILKRRLACGTKASHDMVIAHNRADALAALRDVFAAVPRQSSEDPASLQSRADDTANCRQDGEEMRDGEMKQAIPPSVAAHLFDPNDVIAQEFVPEHGGVVFKVYAIDEEIKIKPRASITETYPPTQRNQCFGRPVPARAVSRKGIVNGASSTACGSCGVRGQEAFGLGKTVSWAGNNPAPYYYRFDSQNINKDMVPSLTTNNLPVPGPSRVLALDIVRALSKVLGLTLLGIDLVYDVRRGQYAVVDVNYFPGYKGMPDVNWTVLRYIEKLVLCRRRQRRAEREFLISGGALQESCKGVTDATAEGVRSGSVAEKSVEL